MQLGRALSRLLSVLRARGQGLPETAAWPREILVIVIPDESSFRFAAPALGAYENGSAVP